MLQSALRVQMEMQRQLSYTMEQQRKLQLQLESHGQYIGSLLRSEGVLSASPPAAQKVSRGGKCAARSHSSSKLGPASRSASRTGQPIARLSPQAVMLGPGVGFAQPMCSTGSAAALGAAKPLQQQPLAFAQQQGHLQQQRWQAQKVQAQPGLQGPAAALTLSPADVDFLLLADFSGQPVAPSPQAAPPAEPSAPSQQALLQQRLPQFLPQAQHCLGSTLPTWAAMGRTMDAQPAGNGWMQASGGSLVQPAPEPSHMSHSSCATSNLEAAPGDVQPAAATVAVAQEAGSLPPSTQATAFDAAAWDSLMTDSGVFNQLLEDGGLLC